MLEELSFGSNFGNLRAFGYGRTDIFRKSFRFSCWSIFMYISIPISTISQISPPFWPKLVYLFSYGNGYGLNIINKINFFFIISIEACHYTIPFKCASWHLLQTSIRIGLPIRSIWQILSWCSCIASFRNCI